MPTPTVSVNALQTTVATPTYSTGSVELSAFNTVNLARSIYGVGLLAQNTQLDIAAKNHASYLAALQMAAQNAVISHTEDPEKPLFTGVNPADRIKAALYAALTYSEVIDPVIQVDGGSSLPGVVAVNILLSAPYHRFGLFVNMRDIGFGDAEARFASQGYTEHFVVGDLATSTAAQAQLPATDWIGLWPADQSAAVMYSFAGEIPNPIPSLNGACAGYPVSLQIRSDRILVTSSFTLVESATGTAVGVQLSTKATDANPAYASDNSAYIIPLKPLKLATQYKAHFTGTSTGVAIDKVWTFTTVAANNRSVYGCDPS